MGDNNKLKGIGGWLIIPILVLFYNIYVFANDLPAVLEIGLSTFWWGGIIDIILTILTILLLFLMFEKRKIVPSFYIWYIWLMLANNIVISVLFNNYSLMSFNLIGSIVWTMYFRTSVRVKRTFVKKDYPLITIKRIMIPLIVLLVVLYGIGFSVVYSGSFSVAIIEDSSYISEGYYETQGFEVFERASISIDFTSDNLSDAFLFDEDNNNKFELDEASEYIEGGLEISSLKKNGIFLESGTYYFVISATSNPINYNLTISADD